MADYPPTTEELIEQLRRVKDLADLYEKVKRAQQRRPYPPEKIEGE